MCKFCDDYCLQKFLDERTKFDLTQKRRWDLEPRMYASLVSVIWDKINKQSRGSVINKKRVLKFCPSCGIRFGSKEFNEYYKNWKKKEKVI